MKSGLKSMLILVGIMAFGYMALIAFRAPAQEVKAASETVELVFPEIKPKPEKAKKIILMKVTAYCPCKICCGKFADGITASGHKIQPNDRFIAADKRYYLFETKMIVPGYANNQPVKVLDRGGAIKGERLDVFFSTHQEALNWGVKRLDVEILK